MIGPVELRIPADPQMLRVARLSASAIASMGGFDIDLLEDTKLAVSEALLVLIDIGYGAAISVRFTFADSVFTLQASTATNRVDLEGLDLELCRTVLSGVTASNDVAIDDGKVTITATLRDLAG